MRFLGLSFMLIAASANADYRVAATNWTLTLHPGQPFWEGLGDSIGMGFTNYQTLNGGGISGNVNGDIARRVFIDSGGIVTGTNYCVSGRTWLSVKQNDLGYSSNTITKYSIFHCGVNDLTWAWTDVKTNLDGTDGINAHCKNNAKIFAVDEIWPTGASSEAAITARNALMAEYITTNANASNCRFMRSHTNMSEAFGGGRQIYDPFTSDNTHPSLYGTDAWARNCIIPFLNSDDPSSGYAGISFNGKIVSSGNFTVTSGGVAPGLCERFGDFNQTNSVQGYQTFANVSDRKYFSSTFTNDGTAYCAIEVMLSKAGALTGNITARLTSNSSGHPGTLIATSSAFVANIVIDIVPTWVRFDIADAGTAGTTYQVDLSDDTAESNAIRWWNDGNHTPTQYKSSDALTWTGVTSNEGMIRTVR